MKPIISLLLVEFIALHQATAGLDYDSLQKLLKSNMALWKSRSNGSRTYRMTYRVNCFCPPEYLLPVEEQVIDSRVTCAVYNGSSYNQHNVLSGRHGPAKHNNTIEKLFSDIGEAITRKFCLIKVTYDKDMGYPSSVLLASDCGISDIPSYMVSNVLLGVDQSVCVVPATTLTVPVITTTSTEPGNWHDYGQLQASLESNMALWSSNFKSSPAYTMTYRESCFCPEEYNQPVDEQVIGSEVKCAVYSRGSKFCGRRAKSFGTIEKLFSMISTAVENQYCLIQVSYNGALGYPSYVKVASSCHLSDIPSYSVSNVRIGVNRHVCHHGHGHLHHLWYIIGGGVGFVVVTAIITAVAIHRYRRRRSAVLTKKVGNISYVSVQDDIVKTVPESEKVVVV